jgi:hypothetical protein
MKLVFKDLLCERAPLLNLIFCRIPWRHHTIYSLRNISYSTAKGHLAFVSNVRDPYFQTCRRPTSSEGGLAKIIRSRIVVR